ncbi:MAG: hypothetical protein QF444_04970 [Phycisphaerales bacterium]|nr:hypothetical protein [Phycisphaerales bacterium]MDP6693661.1 hypothetical protein [Phycisphaerales bacterium]
MIYTSKLRSPISWSIVSLLVIVAYGLVAITNSLSPIFHQSRNDPVDSQTNSLLSMHDDLLAIDVERFEGRSAFFKPVLKAPPPPPPPPRQEVAETPPQDIPDPGPPPPPATYLGPELIAIIGDEAWFRGSGSGEDVVIRLQAGEEKDGLKVVSTTIPSMVTVEYHRGVYELDLFSLDESFFLEHPPPSPETGFLKEVGEVDDAPSTS